MRRSGYYRFHCLASNVIHGVRHTKVMATKLRVIGECLSKDNKRKKNALLLQCWFCFVTCFVVHFVVFFVISSRDNHNKHHHHHHNHNTATNNNHHNNYNHSKNSHDNQSFKRNIWWPRLQIWLRKHPNSSVCHCCSVFCPVMESFDPTPTITARVDLEKK